LAINRALEEAFARCAIDRSRIAIGGFSDGESYALSLGLANGDVFSYIIAFSPGFIVRAQARGITAWYILPTVYQITSCQLASTSRIFVSSLRKNGYNVEFHEFSGGHHVSRQVADHTMSWLITVFHERRSNTIKIDSGHS
jgi:phospholipase/carboxylesterase